MCHKIITYFIVYKKGGEGGGGGGNLDLDGDN